MPIQKTRNDDGKVVIQDKDRNRLVSAPSDRKMLEGAASFFSYIKDIAKMEETNNGGIRITLLQDYLTSGKAKAVEDIFMFSSADKSAINALVLGLAGNNGGYESLKQIVYSFRKSNEIDSHI